jgi:hypothetical protein
MASYSAPVLLKTYGTTGNNTAGTAAAMSAIHEVRVSLQADQALWQAAEKGCPYGVHQCCRMRVEVQAQTAPLSEAGAGIKAQLLLVSGPAERFTVRHARSAPTAHCRGPATLQACTGQRAQGHTPTSAIDKHEEAHAHRPHLCREGRKGAAPEAAHLRGHESRCAHGGRH